MGVSTAKKRAEDPLKDGMRALIAEAAGTGNGALLLEAMEIAYAFVEARSDELQAHGVPFDGSGGAQPIAKVCCAWLHVQATAPEILAVAERTRVDLDEGQRASLVKRLKNVTSGAMPALTDDESRLAAQECPLFQTLLLGPLSDQPLHCQGVKTADILPRGTDAGETAGRGVVKGAVGGQKAPVGDNDEPGGLAITAGTLMSRQMASAARDGLRLGLADAGLDGALYDFGIGLLIALETQQPTERWMRGEDLFSTAKVPARLV